MNLLTDSTTALVSGFQSIADSITTGVEGVAPIALSVMGTILVWRVGVRFFKSVAK